MFSRDKSKDKVESGPALQGPAPQRKIEAPRPAAAARPQPPQSQRSVAMPSIFSEGLHITGNIASDDDVQVDGSVSGDIHVRQLTIGVSGKVEGKIVAEEIVVSGSVAGEMSAKSIIISRTAHVVGDVLHDVLSIESGAEFQGRCQRRPASELEVPKTATQMAQEKKSAATSSQPVPAQPQATVKPVSPPKTTSAPASPTN